MIETKLTNKTREVFKNIANVIGDRSFVVRKTGDSPTVIGLKTTTFGLWYTAKEHFSDDLYVANMRRFVDVVNYHDEPYISVIDRDTKILNDTVKIKYIRVKADRSKTDIAELNEQLQNNVLEPKKLEDTRTVIGDKRGEVKIAEASFTEMKKMSAILQCGALSISEKEGIIIAKVYNKDDASDNSHDITLKGNLTGAVGEVVMDITDINNIIPGDYTVEIFDRVILLVLDSEETDLTYLVARIL